MTKTYSIREVFDTIQGEGYRTGHRSVFVRFAGCNLWDGIPAHREKGKGACARWCDTDFAHGESFTADQIVKQMDEEWPHAHGQHSRRWCVFSGGEPSLQFDKSLIDRLHDEGWKVCVETNGTHLNLAFADVDFITLSPKLGTDLQIGQCDELKVVLPGAVRGQPGWTDDALKTVAAKFLSAKLYVQPQDPVDPLMVGRSYLNGWRAASYVSDASYPISEWQSNLKRCIDFVKENPDWNLSAQVHKWIGLP